MTRQQVDDTYFGFGLTDKNGNPLNVGDKVTFLSGEYVLRLKNWDDPDAGMVKRLEISCGGWWLTPYTAAKCEKVT